MAIHKALDYFFCDRCVIEAYLEEDYSWWMKVIDECCPIQFLFSRLPKEERIECRRIYFPRSALEHLHHKS